MKSCCKIFAIGCLALLLFSCKTVIVKETRPKKLKSISDAKLYKNIDSNTPDYSFLLIKKAVITIEKNGKRKKFNSTIKIQKDRKIWISITALLGIEAVRVLLTQDSIQFIDRLNNKYFLGDYNYLNDKLDMELTYQNIEAILTNSLFEYIREDNKPFIRKFKNKPYKQYYTFKSTKTKWKIQKKWKKSKKIKIKKPEKLISQVFTIDPKIFRIIQVDISEILSDRQIVIKYKNFKSFDKNIYPSSIGFTLIDNSNTYLNGSFKLNKIKFNENLKMPFTIPKHFKPAI